MKKINQKHYGNLEFEICEKDIVELIQKQTDEYNIIQIERENLIELIESLQKIVDSGK